MSTEDGGGGSYLTFEPPDLVRLFWVGDVDEAAMVRMVDESWRISGGPPHLFLLADVSRVGSVSAGARKAAADGVKRANIRGSAVIGASFATRVMITLTNKILSIFGADDGISRFFATEAEALAWIAERRRAIAAREGRRGERVA